MSEEPEPSLPHVSESSHESPASVPSEYRTRSDYEGGDRPSPPVAALSGPQQNSKKLWGLVAGVTIVLLLVAGCVLGLYLSNTPGRVYNASLVNSGEALDKLIDYSKTQAKANYKSTSLEGMVHVGSPNGSYDLSLNGAAEKGGDSDLHLKVDALGEKFTADVLTSIPTGNTAPDVYFRLSGVKHFLDSAGLNSLDSLDGQWVVVDHTLLETYMRGLEKGTSVGLNSSAITNVPTAAELQDALAKAQIVNRQYLFTSDSSKAVLTDEKFIGKETSTGRTVDHYKVGYNKAHLEAYASSMATALDGSALNDWSKKANNGKSLSQAMNFNSLEKSIKSAKSDYTFDLWADTKTKLISKLTFTNPSDQSSIFTVSQGYTGGNKYPFGLSMSSKATTNHPESYSLNATLDTMTNTLSATFSSSMTTSDGTTTSNGNFSVAPSNGLVKVSIPSKAKSITDILLSLGLGGLAHGSLTQSADPFAITE